MHYLVVTLTTVVLLCFTANECKPSEHHVITPSNSYFTLYGSAHPTVIENNWGCPILLDNPRLSDRFTEQQLVTASASLVLQHQCWLL